MLIESRKSELAFYLMHASPVARVAAVVRCNKPWKQAIILLTGPN